VILLNPGPVNLSERVRRALLGADICHREPEFSALQDAVRARLLEVYALDPETWVAVLLSGSGTHVLEAMLASLVPAEGHVLVLENGVYGERMSEIARRHGIRTTPLHFDWGEEIRLERVRQALVSARGLTHLAVVHHETTTGRLNRLAPIAKLCREFRLQLLLDAVSSFGGEAIELDDWGLAACVATANKCLHGVPGLAFAIVRREALASGCCPPRTLALDLVGYLREQDRGGTPFTPAVPAFYALHEALGELADDGGWTRRAARYRELAEKVGRGLAGLGVHPYIPAEESSVVLRSYRLPDSMRYELLHDELRKRGFVIYAGPGALEQQLFRISTMGEITDADIARLLAAFSEILQPSRRAHRA
jgi:2-aminoethylphosphonate-pyruvate transaminase